MYVMPPRASTPTTSRPSSRPATAPGTKLRRRSTQADGRCRRKLVANSPMENSSPSVSSSSTTPIDAVAEMKGPAAGTGAIPPFPSIRPANKYSGIGDRAKRRAIVPRMVRAARMIPSSSSSASESCTRTALV